MKNKRLPLLLAIPLLAGILIGCNPNNGSSTHETTTSDTSSQPAEQILKTKVDVYEGPSIMHSSEACKIFVEDNELFVYETKVNHKRVFSWSNDYDMSPYTYFDFEGKVHIKVQVSETVTNAKVSPLSYDIKPTISGNTVEFVIDQPDSYVVEINGNADSAIQIFANPLQENIPDLNDPNVIYLGPGLYDAGAIPLSSGQTLYLAGGAYVFGSIRTEMMNDITIKGRGIISGETYSREGEGDNTCPIEIRYGKNITIEGIILADPAGWATAFYGCENVTIDNVKIITARPNGDGFSIQGCKNLTVNGGYVRTWDDSLVVKSNDDLETENITFNGVNVWTDLAQSMEVGFETNADYMKDITFKNITVIHAYHKAPISIHNADRADLSNIRYENITIEHGEMLGDNRDDGESDFLIDFSIEYNVDWSKHEELGNVDKVYVKNVKFLDTSDSCVTRIRGDKTSKATIDNVTFEAISINGNEVSNEDNLKVIKGDNVGKVSVVKGTATGAPSKNVYDNSQLNENDKEINTIETVKQDAILVPDFAKLKGDLQYLGEPVAYQIQSAEVTHGVGNRFTDPADDGSGEYSSLEFPLANLSDGDINTLFESKTYPGEEDEFFALTIHFKEAVYIGNIRLFGTEDNSYSYQYDINTRYIQEGGTNFKNAVSKRTYALTPNSGNCIDIAMSANHVTALQFRIYPAQDEFFAIDKLSFAEMMLYGPSLSYNKPILDATEHYDVYDSSRLTDGDPNGTSYYESNGFPASFVIDLGDVYNVKVISLNLPASLVWDKRSQEIELLGSDSNSPYDSNTTKFTTFVEKTSYTFDPQMGNKNIITLDTPVSMRYLKVIIYSNDIAGGYGGQLSEVYVFGSK